MATPLPRVAILLAAFNGSLWIDEQIESILAQQGVEVHVFISVDVSQDDTLNRCLSFASNHQNISVLSHGERFGGAARNFFRLLRDVDLAECDYVSFSDQDDIWLPHKLQRACETLTRTGVEAYSSNVIAFWPSGRNALVNKAQPQQQWDYLFEAAGPGCTYVLKPELANAIKLQLVRNWISVQEVALHDWFFYAFARVNNFRWVIDERAGILYRQHAHNQVGVNSGIAALLYRLRKVVAGWWLQQALLLAQLTGIDNSLFVQRGLKNGRMGLFWLMFKAKKCRRRNRDRVFFAFSCLILGILGKQP